jgi:hypothetical protein
VDFKSTILLLLVPVTLTFAGITGAAGKHNHAYQHKPLHGGVVVAVNHVDYELVAKRDLIHLYLRDHGKPVDIGQRKAKLTLMTGTDKQEVELRPAGDKLEAQGAFKLASGTKAIALVTTGDKFANVRFVLK